MKGSSAAGSGGDASRTHSRATFGSRSWKAVRSVLAVVLAIAFVPIVPATAFAGTSSTGPLTVEANSIYANGAPITITQDATAGIDIAWQAGMYGGVTYEAGSYNYANTDANIYGGSHNAWVESSDITFTSGQVAGINGGGAGDAASTPGDVDTARITMTGGTTNGIVAGGMNYSSVLDASVSISGGTIDEMVYSGGFMDLSGDTSRLKPYYEMWSAGGTDDPTLYCGNYTEKSEVTIQGSAEVNSVFGSGAEKTLTGTSTVKVLGGTVGWLVASYSDTLVCDSTIDVSGDTTEVDLVALMYGKTYLGSVDCALTGGNIAELNVGTVTDKYHQGVGEVFGKTSIAVKDDLLANDATITGGFDGKVSITGNGTYHLKPIDASKQIIIPSEVTWEADDATLCLDEGYSLDVEGMLIAEKLDSFGKFMIGAGDAILGEFDNEAGCRAYMDDTAVMITNRISNEGYIFRSATAKLQNMDRPLHTITVTSGAGGNVSPEGYLVVADKDSFVFEVAPDEYNTVNDVLLDGKSILQPELSYTIEDVRADHTIQATFTYGYDITTDKTALDFGSALAGYTAPDAQTVTITNTGSYPVAISSIDAGPAFQVSGPVSSTVAVGATTTFTVQPVSGLALDTYDSTITINYDNDRKAEVTAHFAVVDPQAKIGDTSYITLQEAFDAAKDGDKVTLLKDVTLTEPLTIATAGTITLTSTKQTDGTWCSISPADDFSTDALSLIIVPTSANPTTVLVTGIELSGNDNVDVRALYVGGQNTVNIDTDASIHDFTIEDASGVSGSGGTGDLTVAAGIIDGAAIYSAGADINMNGGLIYENETAGNGGAICMANDPADETTGILTVRGGTVYDNVAAVDGGGMYIGAQRRMTWTGGSIVNNIASSRSSDVYLASDESSPALLTLRTPIAAQQSSAIIGSVTGTNKTLLIISGRGSYGELGTGTYYWDPEMYEWYDSTFVARITGNENTTYYTDLASAFEEVSDGQTIVLLNDVVLKESIELVNLTDEQKTVTLAGTPGASNEISLGADIARGMFVLPKKSNTTLCLDGVTLNGSSEYQSRGVILQGSGNSLVVNDGTLISGFHIDADSKTDASIGLGIAALGGACVTINGGEISGNTGSFGAGIIISGNGVLYVGGGTITGNTAAALGGAVLVSCPAQMIWAGGTIEDNTCTADPTLAGIVVTAQGSDASTISLVDPITPQSGTITGYIVNDYEYYAFPTMIKSDGTEMIWSTGLKQWVDAKTVCRIGDVTYDSLDTAVRSAQKDDTIYLIRDVKLSESLKVDNTNAVTIASDPYCIDSEGNTVYRTLSPVDDGTFEGTSLITLSPDAVSNITLSDITLSGADLSGKGQTCRALYIGTGDAVTIADGTMITGFSSEGVLGGEDASGSAAYLSRNAALTMTGGKITGNTTTANGTICIANASLLDLQGGTITANRADGATAGVYVSDKGFFKWSGGEISDNQLDEDVENDVFIDADLTSSGVMAITNDLHVPDTTIITGVTDAGNEFYSILFINKDCSYGNIAPTVGDAYLWALVGGSGTWTPAIAVGRITGERVFHGYLNVTDALDQSGELDIMCMYPAVLNTEATRTFTRDISIDHDMKLINLTGSALTLRQTLQDTTFLIDDESTLTLIGVTLDIVDGTITNPERIETVEGGQLLPTLAVKTQVAPSIATSEGGDAEITFEAEKTAGSTDNAITYQWFECSNDHGDNPVALAFETSSTLDMQYVVGDSGAHYYDCMATLNGVTLGSAICTVTVAAADVSLKVSDPQPSVFADLTYGYTDPNTVTYTVTNTGKTPLSGIIANSRLGEDDEFTYDYATGFDGTLDPGETTTVAITGNRGLSGGTYYGTFTAGCTEYPTGVTVIFSQTVAPATITMDMVSPIDKVTYTAHEITPEVHMSFGEEELVEGEDFSCEYEDNVDAGNATITITGIGTDFDGELTVNFKIGKADLAGAVASPVADQTYTGGKIKPSVVLTFNGVAVPDDSYLTIYSNNTDVGIADALCISTGMGNFTIFSNKSTTFRIVRAAASADWTRLAGDSRYSTMAKIVDAGFTGTSDKAILTTGAGYADALSAASLAGQFDCPIITTDPTTLSPEAASEIERLQVSEVIILGGTGSVSASVASAVDAIPTVLKVDRIAGKSRVDTGVQIYNAWKAAGGMSDTCFITKGYAYADALSIAPYAYADSAPIFLANEDGTLSADVTAAVEDFDKVIVLGGADGISDATMDALDVDTWMRLAGLSGGRYGTSLCIAMWASGLSENPAIAPHANSRLSLDGMAVATGASFPDALTSVDLIGVSRSALLLVADDETTEANILAFIGPNKDLITQGYVLGSEKSVDSTVMGWLEAATS